jgi:ribosome-binding factor A
MNAKTFPRNARLAEEMRKVLAELLLLDVNDPRLEGVTVSDLSLNADRSQARVYYSVYGDDERVRHAGDGFTAARSFLRRELGRRMRLRTVPELEFHRDTSFEYGDRMERVFERLHAEDAVRPEHSEERTEE